MNITVHYKGGVFTFRDCCYEAYIENDEAIFFIDDKPIVKENTLDTND